MFHTLSLTSKLRKTLSFGLPLLLLLAGTSSAPAGTLEALNVTSLSPETGRSSPEDFCQVGETLFFSASDGYHGTELWKMDNPEAAPVMAADLNPEGSSSPGNLTSMDERLYFFADDGTNGRQLWTCDGTEEGTTALTSVGGGFPDVDDLTATRDRLFFFAGDGTNGRQLWVSDGTSEGTAMVTGGFSDVSTRIAAGDRFFALAENASKGWQLWTSDGTVEGTTILTDLVPEDKSYPFMRELCAAGDKAFFTVYDPDHGFELWVSDGTAVGTQLACDLYEGPEGSSPLMLTAVDSSLAFFADAGDLDTYQVYLLEEGASVPLCVSSLDEFDDGNLFGDSQGNLIILTQRNSAVELSVLDAGGESVRFVTSIASCDLYRDMLPVEVNGEIYFIVEDLESPRNVLWKTDRTAGGTTALSDTEDGLSFETLQAYEGTLFAEANDSHYGTELWASDGTVSGIGLYADINVRYAGKSFVWNDRVYMGGWNDSGPGLWTSDGTTSGTKELASTPPTAGYCPSPFIDGGDRFYFFAGGKGEGVRLWTSDGTKEGTVELANLGPEISNSYETALQELGGKRYFICHDGRTLFDVSSPELWVTDGTPEGTVPVTPLGGDAACNMHLARTGDLLVFDTIDFLSGITLWASDGTGEGTTPIYVNPNGFIITDMTSAESGEAFFVLLEWTMDLTLWKTDGTTDGTVQVATLKSGGFSDATDLTPCGDRTFFLVNDYTLDETQLWVTEGTEETTRQVADIHPDGNDGAANLRALDNMLFFTADDGTHGRELWASDGTEEGTFMVADLAPEGSSNPTDLTVLDGMLFFSADDGTHGRELWSTDGTAENTFMVCNTYPGDSNPANPVLLDDELYYTAVDEEGNTHLMKVIAGSSSGCNATGLPALALFLLPLLGLLKR